MSELFPAAPRQTKPGRPKPPSKHISAVFNPKIARPERIFEFDNPPDVLPPAKGMRPRPRMQRPVNRKHVSKTFAEELARYEQGERT